MALPRELPALPPKPLGKWKLHRLYQKEPQICFESSSITWDIPPAPTETWGYIYQEPKNFPANYAWGLRFRKDTDFREFAFNFRYQDFDNRLRYRFEAQRLFFDKKILGFWFNNIASVSFPLELGRWYELRIENFRTFSRISVDNLPLMENVEADLTGGSICIIVWEDNGRTPIKARVEQNNLYLVQEKPGL